MSCSYSKCLINVCLEESSGPFHPANPPEDFRHVGDRGGGGPGTHRWEVGKTSEATRTLQLREADMKPLDSTDKPILRRTSSVGRRGGGQNETRPEGSRDDDSGCEGRIGDSRQ